MPKEFKAGAELVVTSFSGSLQLVQTILCSMGQYSSKKFLKFHGGMAIAEWWEPIVGE
jgi:hypothetical protein